MGRVLVACEESQAVCIAFRRLGHEAYSCDIQDCSGGHPEWHIKGDCLSAVDGHCTFVTCDGLSHECPGSWDLLIGHPPCTYLSRAGSVRLFPGGVLDQARYQKGLEAVDFFNRLYNCSASRVCLENPIDFKIFDLPPYSQQVQPYMFGHPVSKATRLWLRNLPILMATDIVPLEISCFYAPFFKNGSKERQRNRSKTFPGLAAAMAEQWGKLL